MWHVLEWTGLVGSRTVKRYGPMSYGAAQGLRARLNGRGREITAVVRAR